ncbi:MAG: hypothetical protein V4592_07770 [Bacteroidota bacterium]
MTNYPTTAPKNNVLTYHAAIAAGHHPKSYSYDKDQINIGAYHAILDFMIWSKTVPAIDCYLRVKQTGQRITLQVYRDSRQQFRLEETLIAQLPFGTVLAVVVERNSKQIPVLRRAAPVA